jgi:hypothetical protein
MKHNHCSSLLLDRPIDTYKSHQRQGSGGDKHNHCSNLLLDRPIDTYKSQIYQRQGSDGDKHNHYSNSIWIEWVIVA